MCKCGHHTLGIILAVLMWAGAVAFFWAEWSAGFVWGYDADYFFRAVVVLGILGFGMRNCTCCCGNSCCGTCPADRKDL